MANTSRNGGETVTETPAARKDYSVRAVARAVDVLDLLRTSKDGASLNELSRRSELAKPSLFRMLRTLEETGLVERVPGSDTYRLGVRCLVLGQAYLEQTDLRREALPTLQRLRDEFNETVHLSALDNELRVVFLEKLETTHAVGMMSSRVGRTAPSHCTGSGKALLSGLDGDPVATLENNGDIHHYTTNTIHEPDALRSELEKIRREGYAFDFEEHESGVRCVACPIKGANGDVVASVSISGPAQRLPDDLLRGGLAEGVKAAAREISFRLGHTENG